MAQSSHAHLDRERPSAEVTPRDSLMSEPEARGPEDHERHGVARSQQRYGPALASLNVVLLPAVTQIVTVGRRGLPWID